MKACILSILIILCLISVRGGFFDTGLGMVTGGFSSPASQEKALKDGALPFLFDMFTSTKIKEFPVKNGKFTNITIQVIPPKSFDNVTTQVQSDSLYLIINGIGVKIGADFEIYIKNKPAKGHVDATITDLGIHIMLQNQPMPKQGNRQIGADVSLDLTKTHVNTLFTTEGNVEEIKDYLVNLVKDQATKSMTDSATSWMPDWTKGFSSKVGGVYGPINYALEKRTQDILDQFVNTIPNIEASHITFRPEKGAVYRVGSHHKSLVDYSTSPIQSDASSSFIKDSLTKNSYMFSTQHGTLNKNAHFHTNLEHVQHQISDDKTHFLLSPESFYNSIVKTGKDSTSQMDVDLIAKLLHQDLKPKVDDHFGSKAKLECKPQSEEPKLSGKNDAIVGTFTIVCRLDSDDKSQEPLYEIDLDLEFTIHPEVNSDGKSLKGMFFD